jgi:hypothetical protein
MRPSGQQERGHNRVLGALTSAFPPSQLYLFTFVSSSDSGERLGSRPRKMSSWASTSAWLSGDTRLSYCTQRAQHMRSKPRIDRGTCAVRRQDPGMAYICRSNTLGWQSETRKESLAWQGLQQWVTGPTLAASMHTAFRHASRPIRPE